MKASAATVQWSAVNSTTSIQQARRLGLARSFGPDLACNATEALVALGRWEEAERVSREALEGSPSDPTWVSLPLARAALELGRGDLDAAEARLRTVRRLLPAPIPEAQVAGPLFAGLAELALWRGDGDGPPQGPYGGGSRPGGEDKVGSTGDLGSSPEVVTDALAL